MNHVLRLTFAERSLSQRCADKPAAIALLEKCRCLYGGVVGAVLQYPNGDCEELDHGKDAAEASQ